MTRWAPFYGLWQAERRRNSDLRAEVRRLELDNAIWKSRTKLAIEQRDRARTIIAALVEEDGTGAFTAADEAMVGSWLNGERPA